MVGSRLLTLFGSYGLFAGLSFIVVIRPDFGPYILPAFGIPLLWSDLRRDAESPIILTFLATVAGFILAAREPDQWAKLSQAASVIGLWILAWAMSSQREGQASAERAMLLEQMSLQDAIRDEERDLKYYKSYEETVGSETRLRRDMSDAAKSLSGTMDATEVFSRLVHVLNMLFQGSRVEVVSVAGEDPLLLAAQKRRGLVVVSDSRKEAATFPGAKFISGLAFPFNVMRQPAGFVKLESDTANAFTADDAKTADLFATMAALSLENISLYESVHRQATHDALTQLHSHRSFQQRLTEEVLRSARSQTPFSLIMCDVDHFKRYNDNYGHQAGDHLLKTLSAILASFARPVDFVARYGGEEFAIILPNFVRSEAVQLAERIRLRVSQEPFVFQGASTQATMSFGVASFPQDATNEPQLVRSADEKLYRAKHGGRNQVIG